MISLCIDITANNNGSVALPQDGFIATMSKDSISCNRAISTLYYENMDVNW